MTTTLRQYFTVNRAWPKYTPTRRQFKLGSGLNTRLLFCGLIIDLSLKSLILRLRRQNNNFNATKRLVSFVSYIWHYGLQCYDKNFFNFLSLVNCWEKRSDLFVTLVCVILLMQLLKVHGRLYNLRSYSSKFNHNPWHLGLLYRSDDECKKLEFSIKNFREFYVKLCAPQKQASTK